MQRFAKWSLWLVCFVHWAAWTETIDPVEHSLDLLKDDHLDAFSTWLLDQKHQDPRGVFSVTNGVLRISGDGLGYLATRNSYGHYRIQLDYQWGRTNTVWGDRLGKARDSGLFLHAFGPHGNSVDGNGAYMAAIECNLFEGASGDLMLIRGLDKDGAPLTPKMTCRVSTVKDADGWFFWDPNGERTQLTSWGRVNWRNKSKDWKDVFGFRGQADLENEPGEWNRLEAECNRDRIRVWLNGVLINEAESVYPSSGKILLQCEGSEIYFKNFRLHPIDHSPSDP